MFVSLAGKSIFVETVIPLELTFQPFLTLAELPHNEMKRPKLGNPLPMEISPTAPNEGVNFSKTLKR